MTESTPRKTTQEKLSVNHMDKKSKCLLSLGIVTIAALLAAASVLPLAVTKWSCLPLEVKNANEIGDAIGGIMGPAVGAMGVALTFLAFWAQYAANREQRRQFYNTLQAQQKDRKFQQFESQFYEMLRLHKENVSDIEFTFETWDENKNQYNYISAKKRDAFLHMTSFFKRIGIRPGNLSRLKLELFV